MENVLSAALSRKTSNPGLFNKINDWTEDINSQTGLFFDGPEKLEYNMYAWLLIEKDFKVADIRNLAEKEDDVIEGLFKEYHDTLIEHKDELPGYLENINRQAAEKVENLKYSYTEITNEKDAEKIYKHNFWACKMLKNIDYPGKKDSNLILMEDMLGEATNKDNSILFRAYNFQNFRYYYNSSLSGKTEKDISKEDKAFIDTKNATIKPNFDPRGFVTEANRRKAEEVLNGGDGNPLFNPKMALSYKDSVKPLLGDRNFVRETSASRVTFNECLNGLKTKHRFWFTGKDTGEMSNLKKKTEELINTMPYGSNDKSFGGRYIKALYDTLKASLNYKIRKDAENKKLDDRTYMGQERYKANDRLLKQVISEIKRVEPVMLPLYVKNGKYSDYPKFSFDATALYGRKQLSDTIFYESGIKKKFLRDVNSANIINVNSKNIKSIEQLELALESDQLLKDYAEKDLDRDGAYRNWLKDPHLLNVPKVKLDDDSIITENKQESLIHEIDEEETVDAGKIIEERDEISKIIDFKEKKEKDALSNKFIPPKKDKETIQRQIKESKEFDQEVNERKEAYSKMEGQQIIRGKIDNYLRENKLTKKDLSENEYDKIWNRFAGEYTMEIKERQKRFSGAENKLKEAKEISKRNKARRMQMKLENAPFEVLIDEIEHEMNVRKLNMQDDQNITASAFRSLFYQVLMDEYGKNLGMDPKEKNKLGCYSPSKIREKLKEVSPEVKDHANKELKNALKYGLIENSDNIEYIKTTSFGVKMMLKIQNICNPNSKIENRPKLLNHAGILKMRDEALREAMDDFSKMGDAGKEHLDKTEKLAKSLGSKVKFSEPERDLSNVKIHEFKKTNFKGIIK